MGDISHHPLLHVSRYHAVIFTRPLTLFDPALDEAEEELFDLSESSSFCIADDVELAVIDPAADDELLDDPAEEPDVFNRLLAVDAAEFTVEADALLDVSDDELAAFNRLLAVDAAELTVEADALLDVPDDELAAFNRLLAVDAAELTVEADALLDVPDDELSLLLLLLPLLSDEDELADEFVPSNFSTSFTSGLAATNSSRLR
ncbi:hypothetical protein [Candidatus Magnetobacterium casense]|uniref:hypothetical protein n=1 Tax=Candidatus Magnetobacterium casense TaxID=1455061 RepID=UPI00210046C0|nr:hypothetical protein [Candidatus Magnetobacterium casensis]